MKDLLLRMGLDAARNLLIPALREYAAKTPGKLDDVIVNTVASVLDDPLFLLVLQNKA